MKVAIIACLLLLSPASTGCAHETVVKTTTSSCIESGADHFDDLDSFDDANHSDNSSYETEAPSCKRVVEEVVVETQSDRCHGVLSCTFTVVGEVIALPFRIVGAAFDVIL